MTGLLSIRSCGLTRLLFEVLLWREDESSREEEIWVVEAVLSADFMLHSWLEQCYHILIVAFILSGGSPVNSVNDRFQQRTRIMTKRQILFILFCSVLPLLSPNAEALEPDPSQQVKAAIDDRVVPAPHHDPVYRIPLRVQLGESGRSPEDFIAILEEINDIWLSQAGICFEMQIVLDNKPLIGGMDIWFMPTLPGGPGLNGSFRDEHNIQVRDTPILGPAAHPAHYPAARTAAHEFGHSLSLQHRQNSDDNLMRSKTFGWQLSGEEIQQARGAAAEKALQDTSPGKCEEPGILPPRCTLHICEQNSVWTL
jgi:hypothetical protein